MPVAARMLLAALCVLCAAPAGAAGDVPELLNPSDLDPSFGAAGRVLLAPEGRIRDLETDGEGRFVSAVTLEDPYRIALVRHLPNGLPDAGFGLVVHQLGRGPQPSSGASALALQEGGGMVVGGSVSSAGAEGGVHAVLARFGEDGTLDGAFGSAGRVDIVPADADTSYVADAVVDEEGRLLAAVGAWRHGGEGVRGLVLRFSATGEPDATFGDDGVVELGPGYALRLAAVPGGGVLVAHDDKGVSGFEATQLEEDGTLDASFGDGGRVLVPLPTPENDPTYETGVGDLALREDGSILLAGAAPDPVEPPDWNTGGVLTVVRLTPSGERDPAFGLDGVASLPADPEHRTWGQAVSVAEDAAGKVVVVGNVSSYVVAGRMLANGTPDPAFGEGGVRRRRFVPDSGNNLFDEALVREGGQILIGGLGGTTEACCVPALMQLRGGDVPDTLLELVPGLHVVTSTVTFVLGAVPATGLFECRLDEGPWEPCGATVELTGLTNGEHVFEARAVTAGGLFDGEGVRYEFVVDVPLPGQSGTDPPATSPPAVPVELPAPGLPVRSPLPGGVADATPPVLRLSVAASHDLGDVLRRGIALAPTCSEACTFSAQLHVGPVVVGRAVRSLHAGTAARLRIRVQRKHRRRVRRSLRATLVTAAYDRSGGAVTTRRQLRLTR